MENQRPTLQGGEQFNDARLPEQLPPEQQSARLTDDQLIHYHITEALREDRPIDHATARAIASQLHGGQASGLYALASSGAVVEDVDAELNAWREDNETGVEVEPWLDALDEYLGSREDPNPIEGWSGLWPIQPARPETAALSVDQGDDEAAKRQSLMDRISAAGVTTLGQVATVVTIEPAPVPAGLESERDDFPWVDAAEWNTTAVALSDYNELRLTEDELDELFTEQPEDYQVGSVEDLGWYGLVRREGQSGGLILEIDQDGNRTVRAVSSDEVLELQWQAIWQEYETFWEQRDAYEQATQAASRAPSGHNPRIWVASLSDYNNGNLYGAWLDATLDPDELGNAIAFMLRNSPSRDAEEFAIFDADDFGGYNVSEYANLQTVSRIAQGVAEHGPAFAEWVDLVGDQSNELLTDEAFRDHYEGEWDSLEDYVEYILDETGFTAELDRALAGLPEDLRRHVKVDLEGIAEEWAQGLHLAERGDGRVWVFDAHV